MNFQSGSELKLRIVSAIILAAIVLAVTWYGSWPFRVLAGISAIWIYFEWKTIAAKQDTNQVGTVGLFVTGSVAGATIVASLMVMLPFTIVATLAVAIRERIKNRRIWISSGILFATVPAIALIYIREMESGLALILLLFTIVWSTDIGAYFAGRAVGGPKLMPSVSPNKTWSGFFGGLTAAMLGVVVFQYYAGAQYVPVIIAGALSVVSQGGDLFESWVKRKFGAKDSGTLIPGHGGIMDRVDGLVAAAVAFAALLSLKLL